jgi:hypothetical protein
MWKLVLRALSLIARCSPDLGCCQVQCCHTYVKGVSDHGQAGTVGQAVPSMHDLAEMSAAPTERLNVCLHQILVSYAAGATAALASSAAQRAMGVCTLLHVCEALPATRFSHTVPELVQGKEGTGPCQALTSGACTAA